MKKFLLTGLSAAFLGAAFLAGSAAATSAAADPATLLGVFQNWQALSTGSGSSLTCYVLSSPRASQPRGAKRAAIYLLVSDYPARKIKAEPQIVFGYPAKEGATASLAVASAKFPFARNEAKEGKGWLAALGDNQHLIEAMRGGVSVVAAGVSARGTKTSDTYALAGFGDALAKAHAACNM